MKRDLEIKKFYDEIQFPGSYSYQDLCYHMPITKNFYLRYLEQGILNGKNILDLGCGTGLITNLFSIKYPEKNFLAIDFSDSIRIAESFARQHSLSNTCFLQQNIIDFVPSKLYDVIICQGVLHHIPDYSRVAKNISGMIKQDGLIHIGVYHPWGKIVKKIWKLNYRSDILEKDQESNPWEISSDTDIGSFSRIRHNQFYI